MSILFLVNFSTTMAIGNVFYFSACDRLFFPINFTGKLVKGLDVSLHASIISDGYYAIYILHYFWEGPDILGSVSGNIWIAWLYMGIASIFLHCCPKIIGNNLSVLHMAIIFTLVPVFSTIFGVLIGG